MFLCNVNFVGDTVLFVYLKLVMFIYMYILIKTFFKLLAARKLIILTQDYNILQMFSSLDGTVLEVHSDDCTK